MINKNSIQDLATRYVDGVGIDVLSKLSGWSITDLKIKINDYITSRRQRTSSQNPRLRTRQVRSQLNPLPLQGHQRTYRKVGRTKAATQTNL